MDEESAIMESRTPAAIEVADGLLRVKDAIIPSCAVAEAAREIIDSIISIADKVAPAAFGFSEVADAKLADNADINASFERFPPFEAAGLLVWVGGPSVFDGFAVLALIATDEFPFDVWFLSSSSQIAQVTIPGPLPPTSISRLARMRVIFPPATSLPTIVRRLSPFNATASMLLALLISNWRGRRPPAGNLWTKEMVPLEGEMRKVKRESEGICVLFLGSGFGIVKLLSLRELTIRYLLSGYCTSISLAS
jgi:hypothetical protein